MRRVLCAVVLVSLLNPAFAADPDWVRTLGKSAAHPAATHVTGFGMSPADSSMALTEKLAYARNAAAANLVASLHVSISSEDVVDRFSRIVNKDEELVDEYKSRTVLKSSLNVDGMRFEEHSGGKRSPAYALAILERASARDHHRKKFTARMKRLVQLQAKGNQLLADRKVSAARATYLECDRLVGEIEEIILVQELLGDTAALSEADLKRILAVRSESRSLWDKTAETMEEAAEQLVLKLNAQSPPGGTVQVNALMLDDSYQYSQFSSRFRSLLERQLSKRTDMRPLLLGEKTFKPHSAGLAQRVAASGDADLLVSGSYFIKPDTVNFYVRLASAEQGEVLASADARMLIAGAEGLELKPRNFLEVLEDRRVFDSSAIVSGGLNLEVWTNHGVDGLALEDGDEIRIYARANRPCYLRFVYHLANGARVIADPLYLNYPIGEQSANRVVELPGAFEVCAPFGSETMQFSASTAEFPPIDRVERVFEGETYDVLADSLADHNIKHRGIKKKATGVDFDEVLIPLTTVPK